jgi:hypothetical protein
MQEKCDAHERNDDTLLDELLFERCNRAVN